MALVCCASTPKNTLGDVDNSTGTYEPSLESAEAEQEGQTSQDSGAVKLPSAAKPKSYFSKIDPAIVAAVENGSPQSLNQALSDLKKPEPEMTENEKVLAHCFCQVVDREETGASFARKTLFIDDLCVDETVRGHHIGKAMYEFVKTWAATEGFYNITLHVWECNPDAVAFYKSIGMKVQQYTMEEIIEDGD